jgi:hypothetical protein
MHRYDPLIAPDPSEWLALTETERIQFAMDYHRRARVHLPNLKMHAVAHAIVEAQIAMGDETPAQRVAQRLMDEGLDRHEAIHAIGSVLMEFISDVLNRPVTDDPGTDPNSVYFAELEQLTAERWLRSG